MKLNILLISFLLMLTAFCFGQRSMKPVDKATLAKTAKAREAAKAAFDKHPKNAAAKSTFVALNDQLAMQTMYAADLTPHQKYSTALTLYRQTLKVKPNDVEAKTWVSTIESIYRSMHKPIPH